MGDWGLTFQDPDADLSSPVLVPSGDQGVIALWKRSTGTYPMTVTHLYAQLFDETGTGSGATARHWCTAPGHHTMELP